ncbi:protease complex subunit PrcB family protein [Clostridium sp. D2Q-11]|uniref:Protease complex subunit PrcB family protein n=1 Tax=Anaeromonas frigoriresistens TaxID=2683708 RepID=A0A942Z7Z1_9FIRM|nr:protease complex subunit PrcB family protein [Anaeromonas frigoriresistens]MBS4537425.1 protease complex subunit PrcB family protein [Anaeromonas frigoriresistens]
MKKLWIIIIILIIILGVIFIPKLLLNRGDEKVAFKIVEKDGIPEKVNQLLPKYQQEERALACKVDGKIYIIVTRGEQRTDGYKVTIDKIEKKPNEDKFDLIVYADYKDPKPDEIVPQVITYPTVVAITELELLPERIYLKTNYLE